ncbi:hypothetical protein BGL_2c13790 [Burkholderia plantarii]|uniref:Uncharacterized protein n=1 Tax=Burkholderia plantarii TaxID=41899 RepID=A0A0B6SB20_BURPL|nr:hypothetical protein BGL_2c13790 [Burkholderia plantarii]
MDGSASLTVFPFGASGALPHRPHSRGLRGRRVECGLGLALGYLSWTLEQAVRESGKAARTHEKQAMEGILLPRQKVAGPDCVAADAGAALAARD